MDSGIAQSRCLFILVVSKSKILLLQIFPPCFFSSLVALCFHVNFEIMCISAVRKCTHSLQGKYTDPVGVLPTNAMIFPVSWLFWICHLFDILFINLFWYLLFPDTVFNVSSQCGLCEQESHFNSSNIDFLVFSIMKSEVYVCAVNAKGVSLKIRSQACSIGHGFVLAALSLLVARFK